MTKYVISGYIGFDNFGDEAIAKVLTSHLKKIGAEKITVLSSNPEKTAELYNVFSCNFLKFIKPIFESDVLISGGGSLLQDITSLKSLIYYLAVIVTALVFNKKVIIFAQGFTPFKTKIGKFLTKFVLKNCNKIYVRDQESQKLLQDLNIKSELITDPVFSIEIQNIENKKGIGIQLRSFATLTDAFLENLAEEVAKNFPSEEIKLFSLQDSLDIPVLEVFLQKLQTRNISAKIYKSISVENTIEEISKLEYLISMRFHSLLIGAKSGVKILGINYDVKVSNLAKNIKFPTINIDNDSTINELLNLDTKDYSIPDFIYPEL